MSAFPFIDGGDERGYNAATRRGGDGFGLLAMRDIGLETQ